MGYQDYTEQDFIMDEYFQNWVLRPDTMSNKFWIEWMKDNPEKKDTVESAVAFVKLLSKEGEATELDEFDTLWQDIIHKRRTSYGELSRSKREFHKVYIKLVGVAAIFLVGLLVSIAIFNQNKLEGEIIDTDQITLELHDGTIKYLDESSSETILELAGKELIKKEQNVIKYHSDNASSSTKLVYNTLNVPLGRKFQLVLSDGTHVYLNSGSKLRYPTTFIKEMPRDVFLDGEAFFSVEEDKERLFTVITDQMNTQVYGTKFNVSSYKDDGIYATVLVEGSVGVYKSNDSIELKPIKVIPGQRAVLNENAIKVQKVFIEKYIAWTENKLYFIEDNFETILKKLERHFNVKIINEYKALNQKRFTGTFIDETVEEILEVCKAHTGFTYTINNKEIIISKNQY
ncbi:FecR family protein [Snuella sedimenti]|uniref:FecR family protein n=1 Tax=Snuella sedimenti TaxID=2798802 RepID=A0A8J7LYL7_9FLAO|nr:FecR family protein [Snuella sedimenti]MBJ6368591.1 FecR family protein [Snuella sedimenti]